MSLSDAACQGILNQCIRGVAFAPGTPHAALGANGGAEITGTGYARQPVSFSAASSANPSVMSIAAEANFGTVGGDWTPLASVGSIRIMSALAGGTELIRSEMGSPPTFLAGNRAFIRAGTMIFSYALSSIFSAAYAAAINEWMFRGGAVPARARYLGLLASGTELAGNNYARLDTDGLFAAPTAADPSVIQLSSSPATFQANATFTGTAVNQIGLYSAVSGGTPLITVPVSSQDIASGSEVTVAPIITLT